MNSLDTNILLYATNADCAEYGWARPVLDSLLSHPSDWILADQVLFEYYRLIRNPRVLSKPLDARSASRQIRFFREEAGCLHCAYDATCWDAVVSRLSRRDFPPGRVFDLVLAVTLEANGVERFYTRNDSDFRSLELFEVMNPEKP